MIIRVNFLGSRRLPLPAFRLRHRTTSMRFAPRSLSQLTRCKPTQYASRRGLHTFQGVPSPKPRLGTVEPLNVSRPNAPSFARRRMLHSSLSEPLLASWIDSRRSLNITIESAVRHGSVTRPKPGTGWAHSLIPASKPHDH